MFFYCMPLIMDSNVHKHFTYDVNMNVSMLVCSWLQYLILLSSQ